MDSIHSPGFFPDLQVWECVIQKENAQALSASAKMPAFCLPNYVSIASTCEPCSEGSGWALLGG